jgi:hypothetical protein
MRGPKAWPEPGPFFGQEAVMRAIEQLRDTFESDWQELNSDLVHVGDRVAVRTVWHGLDHGPELKQESTPQGTDPFLSQPEAFAQSIAAQIGSGA